MSVTWRLPLVVTGTRERRLKKRKTFFEDFFARVEANEIPHNQRFVSCPGRPSWAVVVDDSALGQLPPECLDSLRSQLRFTHVEPTEERHSL